LYSLSIKNKGNVQIKNTGNTSRHADEKLFTLPIFSKHTTIYIFTTVFLPNYKNRL
jgi:hypothetical protein